MGSLLGREEGGTRLCGTINVKRGGNLLGGAPVLYADRQASGPSVSMDMLQHGLMAGSQSVVRAGC